MRRADSQSFKIPNPDAVAETLQILADVVGGNGEDSRYVLSNNPTRSSFADQPRKFRPEIPVVFFTFLVPCNREGLTGKTTKDDVNSTEIFTSHLFDVVHDIHSRPVFTQHFLTEMILLTHSNNPASSALKRNVQPTYATKQ